MSCQRDEIAAAMHRGFAIARGNHRDWSRAKDALEATIAELPPSEPADEPRERGVYLEGDGSALYTQQALWTMARENLDVTVVIFANRAYKILLSELTNVGAAAPGHNATAMLTLDRPDIDWVSIAKGYGVAAGRATTLDELAVQFRRGLETPGPYLVELAM